MSQQDAVPLNAMFVGDFMSMLIVASSGDTMRQLAEKIGAHVIGKRVRQREERLIVFTDERDEIPDHETVASAGIRPMASVYVRYAVPA